MPGPWNRWLIRLPRLRRQVFSGGTRWLGQVIWESQSLYLFFKARCLRIVHSFTKIRVGKKERFRVTDETMRVFYGLWVEILLYFYILWWFWEKQFSCSEYKKRGKSSKLCPEWQRSQARTSRDSVPENGACVGAMGGGVGAGNGESLHQESVCFPRSLQELLARLIWSTLSNNQMECVELIERV